MIDICIVFSQIGKDEHEDCTNCNGAQDVSAGSLTSENEDKEDHDIDISDHSSSRTSMYNQNNVEVDSSTNHKRTDSNHYGNGFSMHDNNNVEGPNGVNSAHIDTEDEFVDVVGIDTDEEGNEPSADEAGNGEASSSSTSSSVSNIDYESSPEEMTISPTKRRRVE
ncbi:unnamed protein product [Sphenostylis stenocarpa]|uniref:Uncharacterized protein n=1 Tax=Sphenostylis stenocarpa TaxID=92480 RepID=A0AA86SL94_9FABA|nr:unnamed protein product [Sphenostylis stenocarpa]